MKRVYVAGPYSSDNILGVAKNIKIARDIGVKLMQAGFFPFIPHNDWELAVRTELPMTHFKANSMSWLEVSDCVLLLPNWETSSGTLDEIERADKLSIPVFEQLTELFDWSGLPHGVNTDG